jgi:SAM-dependent methyltransferase
LECPLCGTHADTFLPFGIEAPVFALKDVVGAGYRQNARCPNAQCASLDRERLVYLFLRDRTTLLRDQARVLHVAPEPNLAALLARRPVSVAVDLVPNQPGGIPMDITRAAFADASFDVVICNHVLEHIPDDRAALREIRRVLRPSGWAILQVPIALSEAATFEDESVTEPDAREQAFGQRDHVRLYGRDYADRVRAAGFVVKTYKAATEFGAAFCARHALRERETIYMAVKAPVPRRRLIEISRRP